MKKLFLAFSFLLILNCGSSKTEKPIKIKTFQTEELTVNYPKTWVKFGAIGHVYFMPKIIRKNTFENEVEHIAVNKRFIPFNPKDNIESVLYNYGNTLFRSHKTKSFKLIKLESNSKFIYKIESILTYKTIPGIYKNEAYFFIKNDQIVYYYYQMRESLFDQYHDDAMLIINSIQEKN